MSVYLNPFYSRAAEQLSDTHQFVSTFSAGAIEMLPSNIWDRLVVFRSSPGTGKTSLMKLFTPEILHWVLRRTEESEPVRRALSDSGAIGSEKPHKYGVLIELDRDYRSLLDLGVDPEVGRKLFLRLLDVRLLVGVVRSSLVHVGKDFPIDASDVAFDSHGDGRTEAILERFGGATGADMLGYARSTERLILRLLNELVASEVEEIPGGHNELYSLELLANSSMLVGGRPIDAQPVLMFDDGHSLDRSQREALLEELRRRRPNVARWYSERYEALSNQELLTQIGHEDRDVILIDLDNIARNGRSSGGRRFTRGRYNKVLAEMARRRAERQLSIYAQEHQGFLELLDEQKDRAVQESQFDVLGTLEQRVMDLCRSEKRYSRLISRARSQSGFKAAVHWRELEVIVHRDRTRQLDLFGEELSSDDFESRSSSAIREGAALAVASEFNLPYYSGRAMVLRLGSFNAHQFLGLCGDLFAEMLVDVSLGKAPRLSVERQDRVIREASERYWKAIPRTIPHGRDVQSLVKEIVSIAHNEQSKPNMPYPPGVTGSAILMAERKHLLKPSFRDVTVGADRLFAALASAVAHNVLSAELDRSVKKSRYMVFYLNRLLCPRFNLPLGYGSFRERRLKDVIGWVQRPQPLGIIPGIDP